MDGNKVNYYDDLLNDKNIFDLYNETNHRIKNLKENNDLLLEEPIQNLMNYLKNIYSYDKDYLHISKTIRDIITFKDDNYNNNITYIFDETINNTYLLLNKFNDTLFQQISLRNNYDKYNINETYFEQMYLYYYSLIDDIFNKYKLSIYSLNSNYVFHNVIKKVLEKLLDEKSHYYQEIINNYSKQYNLILLEDNFDIGEYQRNYFKNELDYYVFIKKYDYVEIYENNTKNYINKIINDINGIESKTKDRLKNIYDYFISYFNNNSCNYIDYNYIDELRDNYSYCLNYSLFLSNNVNYELFDDVTIVSNIINNYCSKDINKYNSTEKINYYKFCFNDFLECYISDFYNETVFYFDSFDDIYKMELDNIINETSNLIRNNYVDENFLMTYSEQNLELEAYKEIDMYEFSKYVEKIESIIRYANSINNYDINLYLFDKLVISFNKSYYDLFNNFILKEFTDNITIFINNKYEIYIDYLMNKISDEFNFYLLLINQTDEIGESSKKAFININSLGIVFAIIFVFITFLILLTKQKHF